MNKGLKEKIEELFDKGYSYSQIVKELNCSKGTVSYHLSLATKNKRDEKLVLLKKIEDDLPENFESLKKKYCDILTTRELQYFKKKYRLINKIGLKRGEIPKEYYSDRRRDIKKQLVEYKGGCCSVCGYNKSFRSLHFHHINPEEKDFTLGRKWGKLGFNETIKKELDKCILVCANCHGEIHDGMIKI